MAEEQQEVTQDQPKKKSSAIKYLIFGLIIMIIIPVVGFVVVSRFIMTEEEDNKQVTTNSEMGVVYPLDVVVVNIANTQATRYLRSGISFEVADESILEELEKRKPQITDMIIMILSNKELDELSDFAGKNQIRKEIKEKVNSKLIAGKIKNVYFTEFVIQ